jgi:hypothetical protein
VARCDIQRIHSCSNINGKRSEVLIFFSVTAQFFETVMKVGCFENGIFESGTKVECYTCRERHRTFDKKQDLMSCACWDCSLIPITSDLNSENYGRRRPQFQKHTVISIPKAMAPTSISKIRMTAISILEDGNLNSENTDGGNLNFEN